MDNLYRKNSLSPFFSYFSLNSSEIFGILIVNMNKETRMPGDRIT